MPKRGTRVAHTQPSETNWQHGKKVLTGAGRAHKHAAKRKAAVKLMQKRLGGLDLSESDTLSISADALAWSTIENLDQLFYHAAWGFLDRLEYLFGEVRPIDVFWDAFIDIINPINISVAQLFSARYESAFRWLVAGHVQRLYRECPLASCAPRAKQGMLEPLDHSKTFPRTSSG